MNGKHFGRWTVLSETTTNTRGERKWLCKCDCGTERYVLERSLLSGGSMSCGCLRKEKATKANSLDLRGCVFGDLSVIQKIEKHDGRSWWLCKCSCGNNYEVLGTLLVTGKRTHCSGSSHQKNYAYVDITEKKYGNLTALYPIKDQRWHNSVVWHCRCDCGNEIDVSYNSLVYTNIKSCGCQKKIHNEQLNKYLTHIDGTSLEMIKSQTTPKNNTTGVRGVYHINNKWVAKIVFQKKQYYLGSFSEFDEAVEARKEAEETIRDSTVTQYKWWKEKADTDPQWANENPLRIYVEKSEDNRISISFLPLSETS